MLQSMWHKRHLLISGIDQPAFNGGFSPPPPPKLKRRLENKRFFLRTMGKGIGIENEKVEEKPFLLFSLVALLPIKQTPVREVSLPSAGPFLFLLPPRAKRSQFTEARRY